MQAKERLQKLAKRMRDTVKIVKQATNPNGLLEMTVRTNVRFNIFEYTCFQHQGSTINLIIGLIAVPPHVISYG